MKLKNVVYTSALMKMMYTGNNSWVTDRGDVIFRKYDCGTWEMEAWLSGSQGAATVTTLTLVGVLMDYFPVQGWAPISAYNTGGDPSGYVINTTQIAIKGTSNWTSCGIWFKVLLKAKPTAYVLDLDI